MIEPDTFICADCEDVMREMPDKAFALALCDPPYGLDMGAGIHCTKPSRPNTYLFKYAYDYLPWDKVKATDFCISEIRRVSKNQIIWGANYYSNILPPSRGWIFWDKLFENTTNFSHGELAFTSFDVRLKKVTMSSKCDSGGGRDHLHPTQKPVPLFVWCLQNYSKPGDLIIDPFCGSGTTALACHKTGRHFICIDKEPDYIAIAKQRYADLIAQQDLFTPADFAEPEQAEMWVGVE